MVLSRDGKMTHADLRNPKVNVRPLSSSFIDNVPKAMAAAGRTTKDHDTDDETPLSRRKKKNTTSDVNLMAPTPITHRQNHVDTAGCHVKDEPGVEDDDNMSESSSVERQDTDVGNTQEMRGKDEDVILIDDDNDEEVPELQS